ncbi:MAG: proline dehydrogenase family protein [Phycisphaerae bacterium]|nr:proline dehydrogenase family protein [Phycisphaerae bacterium]
MNIEPLVQRIGREIFAHARRAAPGVLEQGWWQQRGLEWTMRHEHLKARLFEFIGSLPGQPNAAAVARSLRDHLCSNGDDLPWPLRLAVDFDDEHSWHARLSAWAATMAAHRMARQFIVGSTPHEALATVGGMRRYGRCATLDILGEDVSNDTIAEGFCRRYLDLIEALSAVAPTWRYDALLDDAPFGLLPRSNVSVKLSALSPNFSPHRRPIDVMLVRERLRRIVRAARDGGGFINVDMEHFVLRDATLAVFEAIFSEPEFRDWPHAGIVIQAYLRDSRGDLDRVLAWVRRRGTPITVRLVKGAYWDYETAAAERESRESPVWAEKWESDAQFEALTRVMLENSAWVRPAFGSHNIRSIAVALACEQALALPPRTVELQMLYGMGDPLKDAVVAMKQRLRVYCPMGAWVPGVAYLVRRLLENTANESFLRQGFAEGISEAVLLQPPQRLAKPAADRRE